jgi:hypothetical protein
MHDLPVTRQTSNGEGRTVMEKSYGIRLISIVCAALISSGSGLAGGIAPSDGVGGTVSEQTLRSFATFQVAPLFPQSALTLHQLGVAVARVDVESSGSIKSVTIIQSPGPEVSESILLAIRSWKFVKGTGGDGLPAAYSGKLTYYFALHKGHPIVYSATDSFYVGPQHASFGEPVLRAVRK